MTDKGAVRFDDAVELAVKLIGDSRDTLHGDVVLVRDHYGKLRIAVQGAAAGFRTAESTNAFLRNYCQALGAFAPAVEDALLVEEELVDPSVIFRNPDCVPIRTVESLNICLIDRQTTGIDWLRPPFRRPEGAAKRITFFGIKGGVGRSTTLAAFAFALGRKGKKVLVVDLDLESPGVASIMLPTDQYPDYGVVDWFVEDAVGQGDDLIPDLCAQSPLGTGSPAGVVVVPAYGTRTKDYVAKLARVNQDVTRDTHVEAFADRLNRFLSLLANAAKPDFLLLDSRAGIQDIAAVALTRLDALSFLFALNTPQTWSAYSLLFRHWAQHPSRLSNFRENLRIVGSLVPELGRQAYVRDLREKAYDLFAANLYESDDGTNPDVFNFGLTDVDAPHDPICTYWSRPFLEFDPAESTEPFFQAEFDLAFGEFVTRASELCLEEESE